MKTMYVADDKVIVFLQGLRWVSKRDTNYGSYELEIAYKGATKTINYNACGGDRDVMYDRIKEFLVSAALMKGDDDG